MKVEHSNKKANQKTDNNQIQKAATKKIRRPHKAKFGNDIIHVPKGIAYFDFGNDYFVYGDRNLKALEVPKHLLESSLKNNQAILILRDFKTGKPIAFTESIDIVISYRRQRLANAIHLEVLNSARNLPHQTKEEFMIEELGNEYKEGIGIEEAFLKSKNKELIRKDFARLIHLIVQENAK